MSASTPHNEAIKKLLAKATDDELVSIRNESPDIVTRLLADAEHHRRHGPLNALADDRTTQERTRQQ